MHATWQMHFSRESLDPEFPTSDAMKGGYESVEIGVAHLNQVWVLPERFFLAKGDKNPPKYMD